MKKIIPQLEEIERLKVFSDQENLEISKANVGWHLEHSLLVMASVLKGLQKSNPEEYRPQNKLSKFMVLITGYIPRKGGKAPEFTLPENTLHAENISKNLEFIREELVKIKGLHPNSYIKHPYFGHLNVKNTSRFLYIHTNHHLKIVKDILK